MSEYSDLRLARFSAEDRELIKAGVLSQENLQLTNEGKDLIISLWFQENKKTVLNAVKAVTKDDKKSESKA